MSVREAVAFDGVKADPGIADIKYEFDGIEASLNVSKLDVSNSGVILFFKCRENRPNTFAGLVGNVKENDLINGRMGYLSLSLEPYEQLTASSLAGKLSSSGFSFYANLKPNEIEKIILSIYDGKLLALSYEEGSMADGFKTANLVLQGDTPLDTDRRRHVGSFLQTCKILNH